jgi:hypothetical protein
MNSCFLCKADSNLYVTPGTERAVCLKCLNLLIDDLYNKLFDSKKLEETPKLRR